MVGCVVPDFVINGGESFVDVMLFGVSFDPRDGDVVGTLGVYELVGDLPHVAVSVKAPGFGRWLCGVEERVEFADYGGTVRENADWSGVEEAHDAGGELCSCARAVESG